jgi:AcrR family transcriptional regulator
MVRMPSKKSSTETAPKTPRRASGRPLADDAVGRDIILQTTVKLLKARTPEQLSILEIAAAAGVTRALVRYYFADLKGLLREVTESLMRELQNRMEVALKMQGTVEERVYQRLQLRLAFMREHPQFERLALSEIYHYESLGEPPPSGTPLQRITRRGLELTSTMLMDGAQAAPAGQDGRVDPRFIHLAILSISAFLPTARPLLAELFGEGPETDRQIEHYLRFMSHLLAERIRQDTPAQDHPPHPGHHPG